MAFFVHNKNRGFTLKEILIVGAIIALLATTVLVGAQNARKSARDKQRVSDLQQIQLAIRMLRDADPSFVLPNYASGAWIGNGSAFDTLIAPYVADIRDPIDTGSNQYFYDGQYTCNGTQRAILVALAMENPAAGNYQSVCGGSYEQIRSSPNKTPSASSYIIILK